MASGVKCDPKCIDDFNEMKLRKTHRYIIYHIKNESEITILEKGNREATYADFQQTLMDAMNSGEGRYAVYDYEMDNKNCALIFVVWTPSAIGVRSRMLYASSKDAIKRKLVGIKRCLEANDPDEIEEQEMRSLVC
ncbi:Cofilin-2 [Cichlidogyrus casuarinus]|uniref:Cofilin-2 n=1 Tax=Cichlidogyrus casuarinus TaxID=1844966 RepID=A0ABD2Q3M5_9PLAT